MMYTLTLYITGQSGHSQRAVRNLRRICRKDLGGNYKLEVVDVLEEPERADADKILATPTLIKQLPLPLRKLIGDMSDRERVLVGLDVDKKENDEDE